MSYAIARAEIAAVAFQSLFESLAIGRDEGTERDFIEIPKLRSSRYAVCMRARTPG